MASKRDVTWQLKRQELQDLARRHGIEIRGDARTIDDLVDSIVRARRLSLRVILDELSRDRLKQLCQALELDDSGRERAVLIDRLAGTEREDDEGDGDPAEDDDEPAATETADELLRRLLRDALTAGESSTGGWPMLGSIRVADLQLSTAIYVRNIAGSHRDPLERRIQNPASKRSIENFTGRHSLLLGIWRERGDDQSVLIAFDPQVRVGRNTRFSCFIPLSLAEQAADMGFAMHINTRGERIYGFRPENFGRYLRARMADGDLREAELTPVEKPRDIAISRTKTAPDRVDPTTLGELNIRPKVGMYAAFARLNYRPWYAIAEFIDNSIQSFLSNQKALRSAGLDGPLQIDVTIDDAEIRVSDRAGGIALKDFPRAFSPATPPDDASGLSEFGLGMKAAACWFSRMWTVRTSALGDPFEREVTFDIPRISREGIEQLPVVTRPTKESDHFTVVSMRDLRVRPRGPTLAKVRSHLESIYRVLLADGTVRIRLTTPNKSEDLAFEQPELLSAPFYKEPKAAPILWRREVVVEIDDKRVRGWAGILQRGNQSRAGFSVFRRRRLIEGSIGETYKPLGIFGQGNTFESQRLVGELHVENFDVSHTKDGIQWGDYEERVLEQINYQLQQAPSLLEQASRFRARKTAEQLRPGFGSDALDGAVIDLQSSTPGTPANATVPDVAPPPPVVLQERSFDLALERDGKPWRIHLETVRDRALDFYTVEGATTDGRQEVRVRINLDHDFSIAWLNENELAMQPMVRLIAAMALGEHLARLNGTKGAGEVRRNTNAWLSKMVGEQETSK